MTRSVAVVVRMGAEESDVVLELNDDSVTLAELALEIGLEAPDAVAIDGRVVGSSTPVATAGLWRGSVVEIAGSVARSQGVEAGSHPPVTNDGTVPWVRRPRVMPPDDPRPVPIPEVREEPAAPSKPAVATLLVPVVVAGVTALLWNPMFAMFALISPIVALATWGDGLRKARAERRDNKRQSALERIRFNVGLRARCRRIGELRRTAHPMCQELALWPACRDVRLWERRPIHRDFFRLAVGRCVSDVPQTIGPTAGSVVGVVADHENAVDVIRGLLVQIVAHHGPADCRVGIVTDNAESWDWVKWLPHTSTTAGMSVVSSLNDGAIRSCDLVVVDGAAATAEPLALARMVAQGARLLVTATDIDGLPWRTDCVVDVGNGRISLPATGAAMTGVQFERVDEGAMREAAREMARFTDPELAKGDGRIPDDVRLVELLDMELSDSSAIALRWKRTAVDERWAAPVGRTADGPLALDLVSDGPHTLVAGTTGAGKSEFLRTFVASLAASIDPERLNFVLVDYKGGSAFDSCARLPHTVGLVTDLDEGLAERALVCLEAELRHREHRLRALEVAAIDDLVLEVGDDPLPRLLIVVDEFAALANELPGFMTKLVDIAQRGRSLGVHLVLATQRPAGVVNDTIRANTNLRIALRVQTNADSIDVIGDADAATLDRRRPGRAIARIGQDRPARFQAALVSAASSTRPRFLVRPFDLNGPEPAGATDDAEPTDLDRLVEAIGEAAAGVGYGPPRRPWPDPLSDDLPIGELDHDNAGGAVFGVADDPANQRTCPATWSPSDGHLLLYGVAGSGTTNSLAAIVVGLGAVPTVPHVYVIDCDDQRLDPLMGLPHVGAVIGAGELERQRRALRMLSDAIDERRASAAGARPIVLVVDGFEGLLANFVDEVDSEVPGLLSRIVADGPGVNVVVVASAKQPSGIPHRLASLVSGRLAFRLVDRFDYRAVGCDRALATPPPGRALSTSMGLELQVARCDLSQPLWEIAGSSVTHDRPPPVENMPDRLTISEMGVAWIEGEVWRIPIGLSDRHRVSAILDLRPGDHVLVAGPPLSGRTTTLVTIAQLVSEAGGAVMAVAGDRSALAHVAGVGLIDPMATAQPPHVDLVLIDDAEDVEATELLAALAVRNPDVRIVAAGDVARLHRSYGHWTETVRRSGIGVLLVPDRIDGDLLRARLPARAPGPPIPGRGVIVVAGMADVIQVAQPG